MAVRRPVVHTGGYSVAINLDEIDTTGEYDLHGVLPLRFAVVTLTGGEGWSTTQGEGGGTVTITSFTEDRITGTFQFTTEPNAGSGASGTLQVTSGRFDLLVNRL